MASPCRPGPLRRSRCKNPVDDALDGFFAATRARGSAGLINIGPPIHGVRGVALVFQSSQHGADRQILSTRGKPLADGLDRHRTIGPNQLHGLAFEVAPSSGRLSSIVLRSPPRFQAQYPEALTPWPRIHQLLPPSAFHLRPSARPSAQLKLHFRRKAHAPFQASHGPAAITLASGAPLKSAGSASAHKRPHTI